MSQLPNWIQNHILNPEKLMFLYLKKLPPSRRIPFLIEYNEKFKTPLACVLFTIFFGYLGLDRKYLGQTSAFLIKLITSCVCAVGIFFNFSFIFLFLFIWFFDLAFILQATEQHNTMLLRSLFKKLDAPA